MSENTIKKRIPYCPLLSSNGDLGVCMQENCAWYTPSTKSCGIYVIAHNNILDIKKKQGK